MLNPGLRVPTNLRDTLLVLPPVESRPSDPAGVLALEEKRLGLAILEAEDLAIATDVELALYSHHQQLSTVPYPKLWQFYYGVFGSRAYFDMVRADGL